MATTNKAAKAKPAPKLPRSITLKSIPFNLHRDFFKACKRKGISMNLRLQELMKNDVAV